ncbi:carboxypeptidase regulatory-like domain-containing protein [Lysobacter firmicutimachus]|uniref:Carboxypeptidase regulatory-like domain-containing protein n=1 Tax=Lysobacter firmicutimachus TaxID=1792846 RepID=A0AAU8MPX2_9GAMM
MTPGLLAAVVLALASFAGMLRLLWRQCRAEPPHRARAWRLGLLLLAQPLCAALLYLTLFPPPLRMPQAELTVLTAAAAPDAFAADTARVSLPEAPAGLSGERAPDLATALRRHPQVRRLRVIGAGLEARDREAAQGLALSFVPAPQPRGLLEWWPPQRAGLGNAFVLHGRAHDLAGGSAELLDPAGQRIDRVELGRDGGFRLEGLARAAGPVEFALRLRDARGTAVETLSLPLTVVAPPTPRVWLLAGAPNPESKYLRRWAEDAGVRLHTQVALGAGLQIGDAPLPIDAATLAGFDLLLIDERAWDGLSDASRAAVSAAARDGLGVLLRATGPLSARTRAQWRGLGFALGGGADALPARWPAQPRDEAAVRARLGPGSADAPRRADQAPGEAPLLSRRALALPADAQIWLRAADGAALAAWRPYGRGRVAVWTLSDSFRLVLAGRDELHAQLWSEALATVARAGAEDAPVRDEASPLDPFRQYRRSALCGLGDSARVMQPDGRVAALPIDPAAGARRCAGFWPQHPGWHLLIDDERRMPFVVRAQDEAPGLRANELRQGTWALVRSTPATTVADAAPPRWFAPAASARMPAWPWFLVWLAAAAALWWFERSRLGRRNTASAGAA